MPGPGRYVSDPKTGNIKRRPKRPKMVSKGASLVGPRKPSGPKGGNAKLVRQLIKQRLKK